MSKGLPPSCYSNDRVDNEPTLGQKIDFQEEKGHSRERHREITGHDPVMCMGYMGTKHDRGKDSR